MKKYTIVYGIWGQCGSHRYSCTRFDYVETDNLKKFIQQEKYDANVWFIFEGWPKLEGETCTDGSTAGATK